MRRVRGWKERCASGLAALSLLMLAHCSGSMEVEAQAPEASGPQVPTRQEQELVTTLVFSPSDDGRVEADRPTTNFGGSSMLGADLSPRMESYLRFNVSGVVGPVTRATLRLYATDGSSDGPQVYHAAGGWTEADLTWNTRPSLGSRPLDDQGAISSGTWVEFDVTSAVSEDGELNLGLIATSTDGTDFSSRESSSTSLRPQLVVTFSPAACMARRERFSSGFSPSEDAYVSLGSPTTNYGLAPVLLVDGSPWLESYLRFDVFAPSGFPIVDARLELSALDSTSNGPLLYRTSAGWNESTLTWNTRPGRIDGPVGNLGAISAGSRVSYNVADVVTGDGTYSFGLIPESNDGVDFASGDEVNASLVPLLILTEETPPYCSYRGTGGGLAGWARQIGGVGSEILQALATDSAGGFVAAGLFGDPVFPQAEGFALARYDAEGFFLWGRVLATDDVFVRHLTVSSQGNIFVVGGYDGSPDLGTGPLPAVPDESGGPLGLFFAKFSPSGALLWLRSFVPRNPATNVPERVFPGEVATDAEGNLLVTGAFRGVLDLGGGPLSQRPESTSGFVAKFSPDGRHLWSRGFPISPAFAASTASTVATDAAGNVLVGGVASSGADLGGGPLGASGPFIAKYTPTGSLLWVRLFNGLGVGSEIVSVRSLNASAVAFTANFSGNFLFGGRLYTGGSPSDPDIFNRSGFIGTLSATGVDGWLHWMGLAKPRQFAVGPGGALTAVGPLSGPFDLGGGTLGLSNLPISPSFAVRYSSSGIPLPLWSRTFDVDLRFSFVGAQPDGSVVLGGISTGPVDLEGRTFPYNGSSDLFYLQLRP